MALIEDCCDYHVDINSLTNSCYLEFELSMHSLRDYIINEIYSTKFHNFNDNVNNSLNYNEENLKCLSEENKQLRNEIDANQDKLTKHTCQYETYKKDQKLLSKELKDTHEAFLMAKKYYKKHQKIYYTIEAKNGDRQTIFVQFFTEAKKETDLYSIRLLHDTKTGVFQLLESKPKLAIMEFNKTLQETKDLPGTFYSIRQAFIKIKSKKNDE